MAANKDFSIISLGSENDEEIVIQAGISRDAIEDMASEERAPSPFEQGVSEAEVVEDETSVGDVLPERESGYHETTEEDLKELGPMRGMRMAILIGGLLIVCFIAGYLFLR